MKHLEYTVIDELLGKTLKSAERFDDKLIFKTVDDEVVVFYHYQDCCESVYIEDICGDLSDLVGSPLLEAEIATSTEVEEPTEIKTDAKTEEIEFDEEWTFYKFATLKGSVVVRWYGSSNGWYSTRVSMDIRNPPEPELEPGVNGRKIFDISKNDFDGLNFQLSEVTKDEYGQSVCEIFSVRITLLGVDGYTFEPFTKVPDFDKIIGSTIISTKEEILEDSHIFKLITDSGEFIFEYEDDEEYPSRFYSTFQIDDLY